jgi:hypothetical protein
MLLDEPPSKAPRRKSSPANVILWIVIGLILILVAAWTVWAGHQPDVPSEWAP